MAPVTRAGRRPARDRGDRPRAPARQWRSAVAVASAVRGVTCCLGYHVLSGVSRTGLWLAGPGSAGPRRPLGYVSHGVTARTGHGGWRPGPLRHQRCTAVVRTTCMHRCCSSCRRYRCPGRPAGPRGRPWRPAPRRETRPNRSPRPHRHTDESATACARTSTAPRDRIRAKLAPAWDLVQTEPTKPEVPVSHRVGGAFRLHRFPGHGMSQGLPAPVDPRPRGALCSGPLRTAQPALPQLAASRLA